VTFEHVLVVGAGQMGAGIAQVVAASGRRVSLHDAQPGATDRALEAMRRSLGKLEEKGGPPTQEVLARIEAVDDLAAADLMIEAVIEHVEVKGRSSGAPMPRYHRKRCSPRTRRPSRSARWLRRPDAPTK
jgi:3-hydroxybutyryl-CoA dehydrogenase